MDDGEGAVIVDGGVLLHRLPFSHRAVESYLGKERAFAEGVVYGFKSASDSDAHKA